MKATIKMALLSISCSLLTQGCIDDSADNQVAYGDTQPQVQTTDIKIEKPVYPAYPAYHRGYYPATATDPADNLNSVRDYNAGAGYVPPEPVAHYDLTNVPVVSKSTEYTVTPTKPAVPRQNDMEWIHSQQPSSYTIEMATDAKRSKVAYTIFKSPKSARSAQFGYKDQQQKMYTGVYGSYNSPEEAQKALDALPPEVKASAKVQKWQDIQAKAAKEALDEKPTVAAPVVGGPASDVP